MAATVTPIRAVGIQASAASGHRKSDPDRRRSSNANWWTPLFGWSSEPDYIDTKNKATSPSDSNLAAAEAEAKASRPRFAGGFTEEKARQLRILTTGTETYHDTMYHSAIASRLASDFKLSSE
ncbi:hypothetical protein PIB30_074315 [Stylosanthes scabra]|uniref:Uncharacterized protein n=1 Tax=Stylosanthes scabra TaxID=79078 RepID=A0ABU6SPU8_9FABA|nr:hypothetical protein [Stylosanthes scabra]